MRKISVAAAAFVALAAFCAPASAATIIATSNGNNQDEMIHGTTMGGVTGKTLSLVGLPDNLSLQYLSTDTLSTSGKGVAQVTGVSGGFSDLTITPLANFTFTTFKFNIDIPKAAQSTKSFDHTAFSFTTLVYTTDAVLPQTFTVDAGTGNGSNPYLITAAAGEYINKIVFEDLVTKSFNNLHPANITTIDYDFDAIKQASFNFAPGVPEPATWAEFILGFGMAGAMLRRRRNQAAVAPA